MLMDSLYSRFVPDALDADPERRRRARLLVAMSTIVAVGSAVVGAAGWVVEGSMNPRVIALLVLAVLGAATPLVLRHTGRLRTGTHVIALAGTVMIAVNAYTLGGLHGASLAACTMVMLVTFFLGGAVTAAVWTGIGATLILTYFALDSAGHAFPMAIGPQADALMSTLSLLTQMSVVYLFAWLYERERTRATDAISSALQAAEQANQALEQHVADLQSFARAASHDLRGPAARVKTLASMLAQDHGEAIGPKGERLLDMLGSSATSMMALIEDLLELERVKGAALKRSKTDLTGVARAIIVDLRAEDPERDVDVSIADGLTADVDPGLARVVLVNLLGNAWKYTSKAEQAHIELGSDDGGFHVRDNGAGFDMTYVHKLFEPFERLHGQSQFAGNGVGLATVHRIIARHGGSITGRSGDDGGATFSFDFGSA